MTKRVCNMCGKDFDMMDNQEDFGFHYHVGYGSEFDGEVINLDLCCGCFDKLMKEHILPNCQISPVEEPEYGL